MKLLIFLLIGCLSAHASENFKNGEANFKEVMQKILDGYVDKVSPDDLYRAATAGMLSSLNSGDQAFNKLLTPGDLKEMKEDLTGKTSGVGAVLKFDEASGHALVLEAIPGSPADKSGLKKEDVVLSVDGAKFKGKKFSDMVASIRGKAGSPVSLRVLRDDRVVSLTIKRELVPWTQVELNKVNDSTSVLSIGYFTEQTPTLVEGKLKEFKGKTLIVDLRYNAGGGFTQAIKTAGYFVPKGTVVASTEDRNHKVETFKSEGGLLTDDVNVLVVVNHDTFCAAELLAASLRVNRGAKIIGENTFGKWDAQTVDVLSNGYGIKYTVMNFSDPRGERYPGTGLKPDVNVDMPKEHNISELRMKYDFTKRLALDTQLKAAVALAR